MILSQKFVSKILIEIELSLNYFVVENILGDENLMLSQKVNNGQQKLFYC